MHALYTLSVFVHVLAACAWIGGMIFFGAVIVPVVRRPEYAGLFPDLVRRVGARFRVLGWVCLVVLVGTGIANLAVRGFGVAEIMSAAERAPLKGDSRRPRAQERAGVWRAAHAATRRASGEPGPRAPSRAIRGSRPRRPARQRARDSARCLSPGSP